MNTHIYTQYKKCIEELYSYSNLNDKETYPKEVAQTLYKNRIAYLLKLLGNPHKKFKYIHITGTSGKGSTANMCATILKNAGYKTGAYYSPHLTSFTERIQVNNKLISAPDTISIFKEIKKALHTYIQESPYGMPHFGELAFCMALLYFKKQKCSWVVVEAACGGRCDFTNVIPNPTITLITNIGHDHKQTLGPRMIDIAYEKAGIIKKGSYFFTTEKKKRYLDIFQSECKKVGAHYNVITEDPIIKESTIHKTSFIYNEKEYTVSLKGTHQAYNALLAINAAQQLKIPSEIVQKSLNNLSLPARFEIIQEAPYVILDGAHNPEKLASTLSAFKTLSSTQKPRKRWLICSFVQGKDITSFAKIFAPEFDKIIITRHTHTFRKALYPKALLSLLKKVYPETKPEYFLDPDEALNYVLKKAHKDDIILITGSLYFAGVAREHWVSEHTIITKRSHRLSA